MGCNHQISHNQERHHESVEALSSFDLATIIEGRLKHRGSIRNPCKSHGVDHEQFDELDIHQLLREGHHGVNLYEPTKCFKDDGEHEHIDPIEDRYPAFGLNIGILADTVFQEVVDDGQLKHFEEEFRPDSCGHEV